MEQVIERGCGLDVHRDTVAACVRVPGAAGQREQHVRTFGATAADLLALRDWLEAHEVTHVAMESTGVYWPALEAERRAALNLLGGEPGVVVGQAAEPEEAAGDRAVEVGDVLVIGTVDGRGLKSVNSTTRKSATGRSA